MTSSLTPDEARSAQIRAMIVDKAATAETSRAVRRPVVLAAVVTAVVLVLGGTAVVASGAIQFGPIGSHDANGPAIPATTTPAAAPSPTTSQAPNPSTSVAPGTVEGAGTPDPTPLPTSAPPTLATPNAFSTPGDAVGFGTVRPTEVFNGGDPTGLVQNIVWQSWGGPTAIGYGTACYVGPGQDVADCSQVKAEIVASNLGACGGAPAYEDVGWFFPGVDGLTPQTAQGTDVKNCSYPAQ